MGESISGDRVTGRCDAPRRIRRWRPSALGFPFGAFGASLWTCVAVGAVQAVDASQATDASLTADASLTSDAAQPAEGGHAMQPAHSASSTDAVQVARNPTLAFLGLEELAATILESAEGVPEGAPIVLPDLDPRTTVWRSGSDLVAALDENESGGEPDERDDLYLVDYDSDGTFDRLVDWEDANGDARADRQILLALTAGGPDTNRLSGFFIEQRDLIREFWHLSRWQYAQSVSQFRCDFSGDLFFAAIHVDRRRESWEAFDESFFGFFDPDGDGWSEEALRVSGAGIHVDAIRWSFDLDDDGGSPAPRVAGAGEDAPGVAEHAPAGSTEHVPADPTEHAPADSTEQAPADSTQLRSPYDYDLSITTDGRALLNATVIETVLVRGRRLPLLRWSEARSWAGGQSWRRVLLAVDENDANHDPNDPKQRERWEGVIAEDPGGFPHAGGPSCGQLGKRYESRPAKGPIELYYSEIDRRVHLRGAELGWLDLDLDADGVRDARLQLEDTNADGFFDTWKWDENGDAVYESTYTAPGPRAHAVTLDGAELRSLETRVREEDGGLSQRQRFERDVSQWRSAGRFVPRAE